MAAVVPLSCTLAVPLLVRVTPVAVAAADWAVRVPCNTVRVAVMLPVFASTSVTLKPLRAVGVSSLVTKVAGSVFTGASLTAEMLMATVSMSVKTPPRPVLPPSLVVRVRVSAPL